MASKGDVGLKVVSGLVYLLCIPIAGLTLVSLLPCWPVHDHQSADFWAPIALLLMIGYSYWLFGYRPQWRRSLWALGTALLFLSGSYYLSLSYYCSAQPRSLFFAFAQLYAIDGEALLVAATLGVAYILVFGYWAVIRTPMSVNAKMRATKRRGGAAHRIARHRRAARQTKSGRRRRRS